MSNMGNMGNIGSLGSAGAGASGSMVFPDRMDLPFTTEQAQTWQQVEGVWQWVIADPSKDVTELPRMPISVWPQSAWSANWAAWLVVAEFAATDWRTSITLTPWEPGKQESEIGKLVGAARDERPDALGEILAQNASYEDIMAYFLALLQISPTSHPKTCQLLHIAGLVGILVAMHFKRNPGANLQPRPRPSQVCPALLPPVEVPGHPSFPSGHATQALLMALCIEEAMPTQQLKDAWRPLLQTLAGRVARNREIAGLHYESDTKGGLELAKKTFKRLVECTLLTGSHDNVKDIHVNGVLDDATKEWL